MSPDEEIIWLAGLLEGEGCFGTSNKNSPYVHLGMTDRDIIERASKIMLCSSRILTRYKDSDRKTLWQVSAWNTRAIIIMKKVLPYMGERRSSKINEVLKDYELRQSKSNFCKRGHDLTLPHNVRFHKNGYRMCKKCDAILRKEYKKAS